MASAAILLEFAEYLITNVIELNNWVLSLFFTKCGETGIGTE